jgi:hypothetical protein
VSTELIRSADLPQRDWWYLGAEHGQHIGFLREKTLAWLAQALACNVGTDGRSLHLFVRGTIPTSWRKLQRLARFAPIVQRVFLSSKTITDFDRLRQAALDA